MNTVAKLTQKQIEKLAVEIRTFLLEHDMWVDTQIYFNGKCFDTHDKETGELQQLIFPTASAARNWKSCGRSLEKSLLITQMLSWKSSWDFQKGQTE